jgi:hypothetical protein
MRERYGDRNHQRTMKVNGGLVPTFVWRSRKAAVTAAPREQGRESKCIQWDPKEGELFPNRAKPGEIPVEARSSADVQIACQIRVVSHIC